MAEMRLIDANALKEKAIRVSTVKEHTYLKAVGTHEIDKAPTVDAVPVVRCGKCGRRDKCSDLTDTVYCLWFMETMDKMDFCSYGKKEDD